MCQALLLISSLCTVIHFGITRENYEAGAIIISIYRGESQSEEEEWSNFHNQSQDTEPGASLPSGWELSTTPLYYLLLPLLNPRILVSGPFVQLISIPTPVLCDLWSPPQPASSSSPKLSSPGETSQLLQDLSFDTFLTTPPSLVYHFLLMYGS